MTDLPAILAVLDADILRAEARSAPTLLRLLRGLVGRGPVGMIGAGLHGRFGCLHCYRPASVDLGSELLTCKDHRKDCPYAAADAALKVIDRP